MALRAVRAAFYRSDRHRQDACATSFFAAGCPLKEMSRTARTVAATGLFLLAMALGFATSQSLGEVPVTSIKAANPDEKGQDQKAKVALPPKLAPRYSKFLEDLKNAKRKIWAHRMKNEVGEIANATLLNAESQTALETGSKVAIEKCSTAWLAKFDEMFREEFVKTPGRMVAEFEEVVRAQVDTIAGLAMGIAHETPEEDPGWLELVKKTLTPSQSAAWEEVLAERKAVREREIRACLTPMTDVVRKHFARIISTKTADIKRTLTLSLERGKALDAVTADSIEKGIAMWRVRAAAMLAASEDEQRDQFKMLEMSVQAIASEVSDQQPAWTEGLSQLFTPQELQRLLASQTEHRSRRVRALAQMLIAELEGKVAFTSSQRERLQPLAESLVSGPVFFPEDEPDDFGSIFSQGGFQAAAAAASEPEVMRILDPAQWRRWKAACDPGAIEEASGRARIAAADLPQNLRVILSNAEPEEIEAELSDFLLESTEAARIRILDSVKLEMEDLARLADLGADSCRRLLIAAKGATEESLIVWKADLREAARESIRNASAVGVKERLSSALSNILGNAPKIPAATEPVWELAVKAELTGERRKKWEEGIEQRKAFKVRAIASLIISEFDRKNPISGEQWDRLEPIVTNFQSQYAPEIERNCGGEWYFQDDTMFIPLASIPERDLSAILSADQLSVWKSVHVAENQWTAMRQEYAQRVKGKK